MSPLEGLGWAAQACFFSRFFVQWVLSERAKRSLAPPVFWWISLAGATLLSVYLASEGRVVLLAGQLVGGSIAARNLLLASGHERRTLPVPAAILVGLVAWGVVLQLGLTKVERLDSTFWFAVGVLGQTVWTSRFVVQWIETERRGRSHFPVAFWWISLVGNGLLLAYTLHLGDPILVAGFLLGPLVQIRNLMLSARRDRAGAPA